MTEQSEVDTDPNAASNGYHAYHRDMTDAGQPVMPFDDWKVLFFDHGRPSPTVPKSSRAEYDEYVAELEGLPTTAVSYETWLSWKDGETRKKAMASAPPWWRDADGEIVQRDRLFIQAVNYTTYLGPFRVGDEVIVNDGQAGVLEHADRDGLLVVPKRPTIDIPGDPGAWYPAANVWSIAPVQRLHSPGIAAPPPPPEPDGIPDASLPMNPPPSLPEEPGAFR